MLCTWSQRFLGYNYKIARYICPYINIYGAKSIFINGLDGWHRFSAPDNTNLISVHFLLFFLKQFYLS